MSSKINGVKWNKSSQAKKRRVKVIGRLETQLETGIKYVNAKKLGGDTNQQVRQPLTEKDRARINRELTTLKERV